MARTASERAKSYVPPYPQWWSLPSYRRIHSESPTPVSRCLTIPPQGMSSRTRIDFAEGNKLIAGKDDLIEIALEADNVSTMSFEDSGDDVALKLAEAFDKIGFKVYLQEIEYRKEQWKNIADLPKKI